MKVMCITALLLASVTPMYAQRSDANSTDPADSRYNVPSHNYGWLGLLGLLGLAGLRPRKSADHERLAATGVNVKSVKV